MMILPEPGTKHAAAATSAQSAAPKMDDLLDRVFTLYRARTGGLLWIAATPASLYLFQRLSARWVSSHHRFASTHPAEIVLLLLAQALLFLAGYALSQAATAIYADTRDDAGKALRRALPHAFRFLGIASWQIGSMVWLPAALALAGVLARHFSWRTTGNALLFAAAAAGVYGVIAWLRNSLAIAASSLESLSVRTAMRRSKALADERKRHLFKALISLVLLGFVGYFVQDFCGLFLAQAKAPVQQAVGQGLGFAVQFVLVLLLAPVWSLTFCLLYFDERARSERLAG